MGTIHRKQGGKDMNNYNPMCLFDNKQPIFKEQSTIQQKQKEYKETVTKLNLIQKELDSMWIKR